MSPIVRITDPRGSTPRPLSLVAVALGSVGVGLLLLKLSLVAPRAGAVELEPLDAGEALAEQAGTDVAATRDEPEAAPPAAAAEDELGADEAQHLRPEVLRPVRPADTAARDRTHAGCGRLEIGRTSS